MITVIRKSEEMDEVLKAVKKDIKTTSAKARSVPVRKLKLEVEFLLIRIHYSIQVISINPPKVMA